MRERPAAFLAAILMAWAVPCWAGDESPPLPVRVTIWEGLSKGWSGAIPETEPADRFDAPALGFVQLPVKMNGRGIEVDRAAPFAIRAATSLNESAGPRRLILRAKGWARLVLDGRTLAETKPISPNASGHEEVPEPPRPDDARWREVGPGDQEIVLDWESDGQPHEVEILAVLGDKGLRPEVGEMSVSIVEPGGVPRLIGGKAGQELSHEGWARYARSERGRIDRLDTDRRRLERQSDDAFWRVRHEIARREAEKVFPGRSEPDIDGRILERLKEKGWKPNPTIEDAAFLRRLSLDTIGLPPTAEEVAAFLADTNPDKRERMIDARLADPRWADSWMGYWQDILAENPGILKPTLNNTGPFRRFVYQALADDLPYDRWVTELIRMDGSKYYGGPGGFGMATQNDAPMAAKAHVLAKAFLAADMKCARCHDAPAHPFEQAQLFGMAGLLDGKDQKIPATSTVISQPGARQPTVSVTLHAGDKVPSTFDLGEAAPTGLPEGMLPANATSREKLAALVVSPRNARFARVAVNRVWARFLGAGLVEPVDDWDGPEEASISHPELLDDLASDFIRSGYDVKALARRIFRSNVYQGLAENPPPSGASAEERLFAGPVRRRLSAEQLVDSLFAAAGKEFGSERLCVDPEGRRPPNEMLDLGEPTRAWQFASTANERDRPALSLPITQTFVDLMQTYGWRPARQDPLTIREQTITPLQPALLANGIAASRVTTLSDDSAFTEAALSAKSPETLVRGAYLRILSREPTGDEMGRMVRYLGDSFDGRVVPGAVVRAKIPAVRRVSWSNHLHPRATEILLAEEKAAREGDPPTYRLTPEFRERFEDILWALANSPEQVFVP